MPREDTSPQRQQGPLLAPRAGIPLPTVWTPLEEIEKALCRQIEGLNIKQLADQATQDALDRLRGRV